MIENNSSNNLIAPESTPTEPAGSGVTAPPPTPENPQSNPVTQPTPPKSSPVKKIIIAFIAFFVLIVLVGIFVSMWSATKKDLDQKANELQSEQEPSDIEQSLMEGSAEKLGYKNTTFVTDSGTTAKVEHPSSWSVTKSTDEDQLDTTTITSSGGNSLLLYEVFGVGGDCDPDSETYTLTKKITTKTSGLFFTQYNGATASDAWMKVRRLEDMNSSRKSDKHKNLKEGESNTNICDNVSGYSAYDGIFVAVSDSPERSSISELTYNEIMDDPEFIAMLESLDFTKAQ